MTPAPDRRFMAKLVIGLLMILAGIALMLDNSGLLPTSVWHLFWPFAAIIYGLAVLWIRGPLHLGGHVLLFFGTAFMLGALGYGDIPDRWWPLGLVWGGVVVVLRALHHPVPQTCQDFQGESHE